MVMLFKILNISFLLPFLSFQSYSKSLDQENTTIYVFAIFNGEYSNEFNKYDPGFSGFAGLSKPANCSRIYFEKAIRNIQNVVYTELSSKSGVFLTKSIIEEKFNLFVEKVKTDTSKKKAILFYYFGHGFSRTYLNDISLIPGDFSRNPDSVDINEYTISSFRIASAIKKVSLNCPVLILLDCCAERVFHEVDNTPEEYKKLPQYKIGREKTDFFREKQKIEFNEDTWPFPIYCYFGREVSTVIATEGEDCTIGPLCKYFCAAIENNKSKKKMIFFDFSRSIYNTSKENGNELNSLYRWTRPPEYQNNNNIFFN